MSQKPLKSLILSPIFQINFFQRASENDHRMQGMDSVRRWEACWGGGRGGGGGKERAWEVDRRMMRERGIRP
jgi:hypothetical protein